MKQTGHTKGRTQARLYTNIYFIYVANNKH